jgi:mannosyl-oligosaccharide alpha-1,2-mannosidase
MQSESLRLRTKTSLVEQKTKIHEQVDTKHISSSTTSSSERTFIKLGTYVLVLAAIVLISVITYTTWQDTTRIHHPSEIVSDINGDDVHNVLMMQHEHTTNDGIDLSAVKEEEEEETWESIQQKRRTTVKNAFLHAWKGYEKYSFGHDELRPCTNNSRDNFAGFGATIVDSMDTMLLMGLNNEYEKCRQFIEQLSFEKDEFVSLFEISIRILGGMLGAFELTRDEMFLRKSEELVQKLLPAFDTKSGVPYTQINLVTGAAKNAHWHATQSILSEIGSIQLEFKYLSHHTKNPIYAEKAERVMEVLRNNKKEHTGLYPNYVLTETGQFRSNWYSFGALGDSFYEYLLKQYLLTGDITYHKMYRETVYGIKKYLLSYSRPNGLAYISEFRGGKQVPKFDHLVCYTAGMLALGSTIRFEDSNIEELDEDLEIAKQIMHTCSKLYLDQPSGLGPEIANFANSTHDYTVQHPTYLLRPEVVESLFILYRVTGDKQYVEIAWTIFQSIERVCKTPAGYSGVTNVKEAVPEFDNAMESFFLSETLKYLYLIFSPKELLPLDEFVLNTEAHPLRSFK